MLHGNLKSPKETHRSFVMILVNVMCAIIIIFGGYFNSHTSRFLQPHSNVFSSSNINYQFSGENVFWQTYNFLLHDHSWDQFFLPVVVKFSKKQVGELCSMYRHRKKSLISFVHRGRPFQFCIFFSDKHFEFLEVVFEMAACKLSWSEL